MNDVGRPSWITSGKTIAQLIKELRSFEDQELLVEISIDDRSTKHPISLVTKSDGKCVLVYVGDEQGK